MSLKSGEVISDQFDHLKIFKFWFPVVHFWENPGNTAEIYWNFSHWGGGVGGSHIPPEKTYLSKNKPARVDWEKATRRRPRSLILFTMLASSTQWQVLPTEWDLSLPVGLDSHLDWHLVNGRVLMGADVFNHAIGIISKFKWELFKANSTRLHRNVSINLI